MKREELKVLGLDDEQVQKVMDAYQKDIEKFKEDKAQIKNLEKQLELSKSTIQELTEKSKNSISQEDLKIKLDESKKEYEDKITQINLDYATKNYLSKFNFSNELVKEAIENKFKAQNFKLENNVFVGADEYIENIKKENPNAFINQERSVETNGLNNQNGDNPKPEFKGYF